MKVFTDLRANILDLARKLPPPEDVHLKRICATVAQVVEVFTEYAFDPEMDKAAQDLCNLACDLCDRQLSGRTVTSHMMGHLHSQTMNVLATLLLRLDALIKSQE